MGAYIIAEAGVNHNGRLDLAKELCLAAKNAGADCVKFQTWQTEKIITRSVAQADYQADNTAAPSPSSICSSGWSFPVRFPRRQSILRRDRHPIRLHSGRSGQSGFSADAGHPLHQDRLRRDWKHSVPALYGQ